MASATIQKHTQGKAFAVGKHDLREAKTYANGYVDTGKSHLNVNLTPTIDTAKKLSHAVKERVAEIDSVLPPQRVKKDRVVSVGIELPTPPGNWNREQEELFLREAFEALKERFGEANVIAGQAHFDEIHDYLDPVKKQLTTSRAHLHCEVIPFVPGKGVNGKQWLTKARYKEVNELMDRVSLRTLGVPYQDGTKQKSRGTVEEVKVQSALSLARFCRELETKVAEGKKKVAELEEVEELLVCFRGELKNIQKRTESLRSENNDLSKENINLKTENANLELLARQNIRKAKADFLTAIQQKQKECPELREWLIENGYGQIVREYTSNTIKTQMEAFESFLEDYE